MKSNEIIEDNIKEWFNKYAKKEESLNNEFFYLTSIKILSYINVLN